MNDTITEERTAVKNRLDDIVITSIVAGGLLAGVLLLLYSSADVTTAAILFSLAITAFMYRFLGGIDRNTSFTIGTLKVTGTIAVLLGSFILFDDRLDTGISSENMVFTPTLEPAKTYFFDENGNPIRQTVTAITGKDTVTTLFEPPSAESFAGVERNLLRQDGQLLVTTADGSVVLGRVGGNLQQVGESLMPAERILDLGLFYSQKISAENEPEQRRQPFEAIRYLTRVLSGKAGSSEQLQSRALNQLYYLQSSIKSVEVYDLMLEKIDELRSGHNKHLELGNSYLQFARRANRFQRNPRHYRLLALKSYLEFLSTKASELSEVKSQKKDVQNLLKDLVNVFLADDPFVRQKGPALLKAIADHDRPALYRFSTQIDPGANS